MAVALPVNNLAYPPTQGQVFTTTGSNGTTWASPNTHFTSSTGNSVMTIPFGEDKIQIDKKATLEVNGTVMINGMDLDERIKTIEKVLCIPQRDVIMENKYPKLKALYDEYMHELAKYQTWENIKGENDAT